MLGRNHDQGAAPYTVPCRSRVCCVGVHAVVMLSPCPVFRPSCAPAAHVLVHRWETFFPALRGPLRMPVLRGLYGSTYFTAFETALVPESCAHAAVRAKCRTVAFCALNPTKSYSRSRTCEECVCVCVCVVAFVWRNVLLPPKICRASALVSVHSKDIRRDSFRRPASSRALSIMILIRSRQAFGAVAKLSRCAGLDTLID